MEDVQEINEILCCLCFLRTKPINFLRMSIIICEEAYKTQKDTVDYFELSQPLRYHNGNYEEPFY